MGSEFHSLKVLAVNYPIKDATTVTLEVPESLIQNFQYQPGQHLVLRLNIDGNEVRRCYSLNSCPYNDEPLEITIKRVKDGLVSNHIGDKLKAGMQLESLPPQGSFFAELREDAYKSYFLFAAGSGITPIFSILKSILLVEPASYVNLFYGNKNQASTLFKKELDELLTLYSKRLKIEHTLSSPDSWSSWKSWAGRKGRIDTTAVEWFINQHPPVAQSSEYFICGPGAMNVGVKKTLLDLGIPKEKIYLEQFGGVKTESDNMEGIESAELSVTLNSQSYKINVPRGQTILQALKTSKASPPYSCESGVCGTCVAKVKIGEAEMKSCMALDDAEIEQGLILTCQAVPSTEKLEIEFEQ